MPTHPMPCSTAANARTAFVRNGDVFVRDLRSGALTQLTRTIDEESRPQWSRDGGLVWRVGDDWYRWTRPAAWCRPRCLKAEDAPDKAPKADDLRDRQLRLIDTLRNDRDRREAARKQDEAWRARRPHPRAGPIYLGKDVDIADSALSPDGRWLLVVTTEKDADAGTRRQAAEVRDRVGLRRVRGRAHPRGPQRSAAASAVAGRHGHRQGARTDVRRACPGIDDDPLAALRKAAGKHALKGNRAVR